MRDAFGANAALRTVRSAPAGTVDAYGDTSSPTPATAPAVWAGDAPAHLRRVRRMARAGAHDALVEVDELVVRRRDVAAFARPGSSILGAIVEVDDHRAMGAPERLAFRVTGAELRAAGTTVDSVRLELARLGESTA